MNWPDGIGYLASLLVLTTFCMRTMLHLRVAAIFSNLAFLVYGFADNLYPVLLLHLVLLPLNVARFAELSTASQLRSMQADLHVRLLALRAVHGLGRRVLRRVNIPLLWSLRSGLDRYLLRRAASPRKN
jgi:hypothetical protein